MPLITNFNRTKVVATLGPACNTPEVLRAMILAGLDVCRINFSHGNHEEHKKVVDIIRELNKELNTNVAILGDLQGPKIRIGKIKDNSAMLIAGAKFIITTKLIEGDSSTAYLSYQDFPKDVAPGDKVLMDDGKLQLEVVKTNGVDEVETIVVYGGEISSNKGVNLPNTKISMPALTPKDVEDLAFIVEHDFDFIALSFVREAKDIDDLRGRIEFSGRNIRIVAKIEKPQAVENIDEIIATSDAIMVARGDLGVEMPIEQLPRIQKLIVRKCKEAAKPVIVATQLMDSMRTAFMPTRAEAVDVANAVMEGADAVMLSNETSVGNHPIKVVESMERIIQSIEEEDSIYNRAATLDPESPLFYSDTICYTAVQTAEHVKANAIIAMTKSGYTAHKISSYRPRAFIFVFTNNIKLLNQISLYWGVRGYYYDKFNSTDETIQDVREKLVSEGHVKTGDVIINTASMPLHWMQRTNMIKLTVV